jgi:polyketide synthase 5
VDLAALRAAHPSRVDGTQLRQRFDERGVQFGPAFTGLVATYSATGNSRTLLAEVKLPGAVRAQQLAYRVHPALLDACFQSVAAHPSVLEAGDAGLLLPLGVRRLRSYGPGRDGRYCLTRVTVGDGAEVEADLDLLDESGTVVLTVRGLRMGNAAKGTERDHMIGERLLTVDWQQRELPEVTNADAEWLLITTSDTEAWCATTFTDALTLREPEPPTMCWPHHADHVASAERLGAQLNNGGFNGVVILAEPPAGEPDEGCLRRGREHVWHLVRIARELTEIQGELPRLYVMTRNARTVVTGDVANLEQAGLRGLMRVIGTEHPHLCATQIDVDEATGDKKLQELLGVSEEDETAWRTVTGLRPGCPSARCGPTTANQSNQPPGPGGPGHLR